MATHKWVIGLVVAGAVSAACAESGEATTHGVIGKVGTVYVSEARGLYIEKKLLKKIENKELWADVRFENSRPDDTNYEMFKLPPEATIEPGDLVNTKTGDNSALAFKLLPDPNKITQLVAKRDTLMAMTFGLPKSPKTVEWFLAKKDQ